MRFMICRRYEASVSGIFAFIVAILSLRKYIIAWIRLNFPSTAVRRGGYDVTLRTSRAFAFCIHRVKRSIQLAKLSYSMHAQNIPDAGSFYIFHTHLHIIHTCAPPKLRKYVDVLINFKLNSRVMFSLS